MDYLALENIRVTNAVRDGAVKLEQVRDAVFRLWIEPNDMEARRCLSYYLRYGPEQRANDAGVVANGAYEAREFEHAMQSRAKSRIAHGIHRYDRYKEPLLPFLSRDVINAFKDLYDTRKRYLIKEHERVLKAALKAAAAREASAAAAVTTAQEVNAQLEEAAKKLGVEQKKLKKLLAEILKRAKGEKSALNTEEMARSLGVSVEKLEELMYGRAPVNRRRSQQNAAVPVHNAEPDYFEQIEKTAQELGIPLDGKVDIEAFIGENASMHIIRVVDEKFREYLRKLIDKKEDGERAGAAPRRLVKRDGEDRVEAQCVQRIPISEKELVATLKKLKAYRKELKEKEEKKRLALPKKEPLPPVETFASWYDHTRKGEWNLKRREMHLFIYEVCHLADKRYSWENLDAMFLLRYKHKPNVGAKKVLFAYDRVVMEEFMAFIASKSAN